jgi:DNA-binding CsgD family transcriptional regulator
VLHVDGDGRISFAHPLIASTVYSSATSGERRAMHERLAAVVRDPEQRVRHLALAVDGPDERVAAELEAAAAQATTHVAVELAQLAYDLTPQDEPEARTRRALALAEDVFRAGDTVEARTIVERVVDERPAGPLRARALELLARILFVAGTASEAYAAAERALAEAGDAVELRARVHATASRVSYHDFELGRRHSARALELLDRLEAPDPVLLQEVLTSRVDALIHANDALPHDLIDRALQLEEVAPVPDVADRMSAALGAWLKLFGDFDGARQWLERTHRAALDEGDDASLPYALSHLPQLELWSGNWAESERCALEHLDLAEEMAQPDQRRQALYNLAAVHAHLGRVDDARAEAETLLADARAAADTWGESNAEAVLGLLELSRGDSAAAVGHLERNFELREALAGSEAPRAFVDLVEALVAEGDIERGDAVARVVSERARRQPLRVVAAYGRGLVAAARGDLDAAAAAFDESLEHVVVPFDRARTLLAYGLVRRRRGERRAAKETLEEARTIFEELGAELWAERAAAELRRIPIRRAAGDELTPTEERVAELAAAGRTNREMAQALFMSPKSVEANLTRIYRKLGIGSRAELGATMAERAKA